MRNIKKALFYQKVESSFFFGSVCCYSRVSLISGTAIATQVDFILIEP